MKRGSGLTILAEADDDEGGIKYVQFFLDDQLLTTKPRAPFSLTYTIDVEPGEHRIRAEATDFAGNAKRDEVEITVED